MEQSICHHKSFKDLTQQNPIEFQDSGNKMDQFAQGRWTSKQLSLYRDFILANSTNFDDAKRRRTLKMFKMMSMFIGSRSANQCRSHHQKMEKSTSNTMEIVAYLDGCLDKKPRKRREDAQVDFSINLGAKSHCFDMPSLRDLTQGELSIITNSPNVSDFLDDVIRDNFVGANHSSTDDILAFDDQLMSHDSLQF